jgi:hypothetical protein
MTPRLAIAALLITTSTAAGLSTRAASAQPPAMTDAVSPTIIEDGRNTSRVMVGAGAALFANYPMSIEDPGVALFASKPLWLGNRYRFFQWAADINALAGFGVDYKHAYLALGPQVGPNFYLGSVFGLELRFGVDGMLQAGERMAAGIGLSGAGGYVFRFWDDDRKRLKLWMQMHYGFYIADDPGNDLATNAAALALGLGYETPL